MARSQALIDAVNNLKLPLLPRLEHVPDDKWRAEQQHLSSQYQDFRAKLKQVDSDIRRYTLALPLVTQEALDYRDMAKDHDVYDACLYG